jgi:hypothetical protein
MVVRVSISNFPFWTVLLFTKVLLFVLSQVESNRLMLPVMTGYVPLENVTSSNYTGTLVQTAGSELYTAAADNTTIDFVFALCEPVLPGVIYRVQNDADVGTTTGSDVVGHQATTDNGRQIDESDVADTISQLLIVNVPDDEADVVDVVVRECQLAGIHA